MTEQTAETFTDPASFAKLLADAQGAEPAQAEGSQEGADDQADGNVAVTTQAADEQADAKGPEDQGAAGADGGQSSAEDQIKPVPYSRFKQVNEKASTLEGENALLKQQLEAFNSMLSKKLEGDDEGGAGEEVSIDGLDPLDPDTTKALLSQIKELQGKIKSLEGKTQTQEVGFSAQRQKAEFEKQNPDFEAALDHLGNAEIAKYEALLGSRQEAAKAATASIGQIVAACHKQGKNVPDTLYRMAKAAGYAPKQAKAAPAPDLERLEENKKKTATVATIPGVGAAPNPIGVYATKEGFEKHMLDGKGRVDSAKFQQMLKKISDNDAKRATA